MCFKFLVCLSLVQSITFSFGQNAVVTGELKRFHKTTLTWDALNFNESVATFKDYRLNVTFSAPSGKTYVVPGYFAADGNASETSATSGNKWRCHFLPLETGQWSYTVSFRTGNSIAVSLAPNEGTPVSPLDGNNGTFTITETDKTGVDFRAKGKLQYVGEHFLQFTNGEYFVKFGSDTPETFLEYVDFDNTNSTRSYSRHLDDWNPGDPTWQGDKGKSIIGAINYLSEQGVNAQYFVALKNHPIAIATPYIDHLDNYDVFDVSKLDQWQIVFDHMVSKGVMPHFVMTETQSQSVFELFPGASGDPLFADTRKLYFREMLARFGYLNAITWNIGEENGWTRQTTYGRGVTDAQRIAFANYLDDLSYYSEMITVHNGPADVDAIFYELTGVPAYAGTSIQNRFHQTTGSRDWVKKWRRLSAESGHKWVVNYDEPWPGGGVIPDVETFRTNVLWAALLSGAAGVENYGGSDHDRRGQDLRPFQAIWESMQHAKRLFYDIGIPFTEMENQDEIVNEGYCLAKAYDTYVIYLPNGGSTNIDLVGEYSVQWYDPRNGGDLQNGSITSVVGGQNVSLGNPPNSQSLDWVILLRDIQGPVAVTGINIISETTEIGQYLSSTLEAQVVPANADNTAVTWSSNNPSVLTIDDSGSIYAVSPGTALITATSVEGSFTDTLLITVVDSSEFCTGSGTILMERYNGISGTSLSDLFNASSYPENPDSTSEINRFEIPINTGDSYGVRVSGYLCAPETGTYYFWVSGDDESRLNLSTDNTNANVETIASVPQWSSSREWNKFIEQKSQGIPLEAGDTYYIEAFMKEGAGGDNLAVGWRKPSEGDGTVPTEVIPGSVLSPDLEGTVIPIPVTGVLVSPSTLTLTEGETAMLVATVSPTDADDTGVTWSSANNGIATVDGNGLVTAIGVGTVSITATTDDGGLTSSSTVTVEPEPVPVTSVEVNPSSLTLTEGETAMLVATVSPMDADDPAVTWSSSDNGIATVDGNGLVTALSAGSVSITATTNDGGFVSSSTVTVESPVVPVTGVLVSPSTLTLTEGETAMLVATVSPTDADDPGVSWSSDNGIATVDGNGLVTALSAGSVSITATTNDGGFVSSSTVTVESPVVPVTGVLVSPSTLTLTEGETAMLVATVSPTDADDPGVSWSSADNSIATVDGNGLVTAVSAGNVSITATTDDGGFISSSTVTVEPETVPVTGVEVSPSSLTLTEGETAMLVATVSPTDADDPGVSWSSADNGIATVDGNGLVTALSAGNVSITATTDDGGFTSSSTITVEAAPVPVTGVEVSPSSLTLTEGETAMLVATVSPTDADDPGVSWSSADNGIATVDGNGLVTALSAGNVSITATTDDGGFTSSSTITVEAAPVPVTGVEVSPLTLTLTEGETAMLVATVSPIDADDSGVTWSSADNGIATVHGNGLVTAVSAGSVSITATTNDGGFTSSSTVTVEPEPVPVMGVEVNPSSLTLTEGGTAMLVATVSPVDADNPGVTWSSGDDGIATVDGNGLVTAVSAGSVSITATTNDGGFVSSSTITVEASTVPVTGVEVNPSSLTLTEGETAMLVATVSPVDADNPGVTWSSADNGIATVDGNGLVTALSAGSVSITATTNDGGFISSSTVTVESPVVPVTGVLVSPSNLTLTEGETAILIATVSPMDADNPGVSWSSADNGIATVDGNGLVTALSTGSVSITATTNDGGFVSSSTITVEAATVPVTGVEVNPSSLTLTEGETAMLVATVSPVDADNPGVTWSSADNGVASVDGNGLVTAVSAGSVSITATTNDGGFISSSTVTVESPVVPVTGVLVSPSNLTLTEGETAMLVATVSPVDADNPEVTWSSTDNGIATVDGNGLVTALSAGSVSITATTDDGGFTSSSTITVEAAAVPVTGVEVSPLTLTLTEGGTAMLIATVSPMDADNPGVTWSSTDNGIATVDANGLVTALSAGSVSITATTNDGGYEATIEVDVLSYLSLGNSEEMTIFPNPAVDWVNIGFLETIVDENPVKQVLLFDSSGRLIDLFQDIGSTEFLNVFQINISSMEAGIYTLKILLNDEKAYSGRFLIR